MDSAFPASSFQKKLTIAFEGTFLGFVGFDKFKAAFKQIDTLQKDGAAKAEGYALKAARAQEKAVRDYMAALEQQSRLQARLSTANVRLAETEAKGMVLARQKALIQIEEINRQIRASDERVAVSQRNANAAAATATSSRALANSAASGASGANLRRGLGMAGTAALGTGAVLGFAGYELARTAAGWQTYGSQQMANAPMNAAQFKAYQQRALALAVLTGANPQDILLSERYAAERGFGSGPINKAVLQNALKLGLPTGGSAALAPSEQAIITLMKNFPSLGKNPRAAAGMILAAAQNSAGTTVPDFVNAIPHTLVAAGHFGKKNVGDSLAMIAALTQAGMPIEDANTMAYNLLLRTASPTPVVKKFLAGLFKDKGIDLRGDFTPQAVAQKGIAGVLSDIKAADLDQATLRKLFPYMRAYIGALGLTGNQSNSFLNIRDRIDSGQGQKALDQNYQRYLGLTTTQALRLQQAFKADAVVLGTAVIPALDELLKELIPVGKSTSDWVKENKGLVDGLIQLSPWLIGAGLGIKGLLIAGRAATAIKGLDTAIGLSSALGLRASLFGLRTASTAAVGSEAAGAGLLGMLSAALALSAALNLVVLPAVTAVIKAEEKWANIHLPGGKGLSDFLDTYVLNGRNPFMPGMPWPDTGGSSHPPTGSGGTAPTPHGTTRLPGSYASITPSGIAFGSNFTSQGTAGNAAGGVGFIGYRASGVLYLGGPSGTVTDTDFGTGTKSFPVKLPGGNNAEYRYLGTITDKSAGTVQLWVTPSVTLSGKNYLRGHFAVLHLRSSAKLKVGAWYRGGTVVGMSGFPPSQGVTDSHLCIQADAPARAYFQWAEQASALPSAGGANGVSFSPSAGQGKYSTSFTAAGTQDHVDPSVLSGIGWTESPGHTFSPGYSNSAGYGTMGVSVAKYGSGAGGQVGGAGHELDYWRNYVMKNPKDFNAHKGPADRVLAMLGIKKPTKNEEVLVIALAHYNAGFGPGLDSFKPGDGNGMYYALTVLTHAMSANHGAFPSTYYTGQGGGRVPTGGVDYAGPSSTSGPKNPTTPAGWASQWAGKASKLQSTLNTMLAPYANADGSINWKAMPKAVRAAVDKTINQIAYDQYMAARGTLNADIKDPKVRGPLMSANWTQYLAHIKDPEKWWTSGGSGKGGAYSGTAGHVSQLTYQGRCAAEAKANVIRHAIAGAGVESNKHLVAHTSQNAAMIHLLAQIAKNTGGTGITRPGPGQGATRVMPSRSRG